ncbi:hypothetical protein EZS27_042704, partial [termite gut metagenome]
MLIYHLPADAHSHKIVGYSLYHTLESEGTIMALQMAIEATPENKRIGLIHPMTGVRGNSILLSFTNQQRVGSQNGKQRLPAYSVSLLIHK